MSAVGKNSVSQCYDVEFAKTVSYMSAVGENSVSHVMMLSL